MATAQLLKEGPTISAASVARFYRPELDALRLFAFLMVFAHHLFARSALVIVSAGKFGLSLFFVLSAYLIQELLTREANAVGTIHVRRFYVRRILRIWPVYFVTIIAAVVISKAIAPDYPVARWLQSFSIFCGSFYYQKYPGAGYIPAEQMWSVGIEEQFYLIWPLVALFGRRVQMCVASCSLIYSIVAVTTMAYHATLPVRAIWYSSSSHLAMFAIGILLSLTLRGAAPQLSMHVRVILAVGSVVSFVLGASWFDLGRSPLQLSLGFLFGGCGAVLLLVACIGLSVGLHSASVRWGRMSYGLYAYHQFGLFAGLGFASLIVPRNHSTLTTVIQGTIAIGTTGVLAHNSYYNFERIFLRWKDRFAAIHTCRA